MKGGVPSKQWFEERDAARARSRPLADARRARTAEPEPIIRQVRRQPKSERDAQLYRRSLAASAEGIIWFEPRPLLPGASLLVVGVASDAAPELLREYGVKVPT